MRPLSFAAAVVMIATLAFAQSTSPESLYERGMDALSGSGPSRSDRDAVDFFRRSAEAGYAPAQLALGYMLDTGTLVAGSQTQAIDWLKKAAAQGDMTASWMIGRRHYAGGGVPQDPSEAMRWLEPAAGSGNPFAAYYLARIYSDNNGSHTDHAKAYELYMKIAEEHTDVDPDDDQRAPYVAKAMTRIAGYLLNGLPEANLKPNPKIAMEYLREAAQFFRDEDAQFELAKLYLRGEGIEKDTNYAKHWLSVLSQKGHPGAQAFLADLLWRGKDMPADPVRALALISVAVANAPPYER
ncbi:MAG TPA: tetratricopeptide repeat protein, partial [Burkholderiaceae bacterium]|nr:tetratricopeptide repeat protein [Burkholderiaceae bacterium]